MFRKFKIVFITPRGRSSTYAPVPRDLNQLMNPAYHPSLNRTFASQTDIVCPDGTTCIYAFPDSGCSSSSDTEPIYAEIIDGAHDSCAPWSEHISFHVISVLFWLGDRGAQSITFYNAQDCTETQMPTLTTSPYQWSCYSISSTSIDNGARLLAYKAIYS